MEISAAGRDPNPLGLLPWLAPFEPWFGDTDPRGSGHLDIERLNVLAGGRAVRLSDGRPVRFADAGDAGDAPYELKIAQSGRVPTRTAGPGMLHDWFNALCWLRWPAIKERLNQLQAAAIRAGAVGGARGSLRDAITLFDENGALFVSDDGEAIARWRNLDWNALLLSDREGFHARIRVFIVGHSLLEKLLAPYKGICAHALLVAPPWPRDGSHARAAVTLPGSSPAVDALDSLDRRVAAQLDARALARDCFTPLPLLGIPGWWRGNEDPAFYNDPTVFRRSRRRRL